MKSIALISVILVAVAALALAAAPTSQPSTTTTPCIKARDLYPHIVIGLLGKPLGTRMVIGGVQAEHVMLSNPLKVSEIDGAKLDASVSIEIEGEVKIEKGVTYRLEGYESGRFTGPPDWVKPEAQQPFQFHSMFVVTKVIEPKTP